MTNRSRNDRKSNSKVLSQILNVDKTLHVQARRTGLDSQGLGQGLKFGP